MKTEQNDGAYVGGYVVCGCQLCKSLYSPAGKLNLGYRNLMQRFKKDKVGGWPGWKEPWPESWLT